MDVSAPLAEVRRRIAGAGDESRVRIVAVTKGFGPEAVEAAAAAGLEDVAESYAQELLPKVGAAGAASLRWHFVGRLQSNKVRQLVGAIDLWQSVDRASVGDELARRAPGAAVLVQVNVSGEVQKGGCARTEVGPLVARLRRADLEVQGLMAVGASGSPGAARPGFRLLRELADDLGLPERSMGMSGDLEVAVEEGSTMVRVGRALFGDRPRTGPLDPPN